MGMKLLPPTAIGTRGAEYERTYHHVDVDPSATIEDLMRPNFWAHHVNRLRVKDIVDVLATDGSYDVQFRVLSKGVGFVNLRPLRIWQREEERAVEAGEVELPALPEGYTVNFAPKQKWRVMTDEPHTIISKDHESKLEAYRAAIAHARIANPQAA